MTRPQAQRPLASNERGAGDDPPPRATGRRPRAIVLRRGTASQPRVTKRLIRVNYSVGRSMPIDQITDHVTEGTAASVVSWFNNAAAEASAHYQVRKAASDGGPFADIDQFVEETDRAWHNGRVADPVARLVLARAGRNPNAWSIGIEHEGKGTEEMTPQQRASSLWLHRDIMSRHPQITIDRTHIVGHREVYARKTCPGGIDVDRIVRELAAGATPTPSAPAARAAPRIVWSNHYDDYLIVVRVVSDTEWYFVRAAQLSAGQRAQTPLSQMPLQP